MTKEKSSPDKKGFLSRAFDFTLNVFGPVLFYFLYTLYEGFINGHCPSLWLRFSFLIGFNLFFLIAAIIFLKKKYNIPLKSVILTSASFALVLSYLFCRMLNGVVKDYMITGIPISASQFADFASMFSIGYGLSQIPATILLGKKGLRVVAFLVLLAGGSTIVIAKVGFGISLAARVFQGIGLALAFNSMNYILSQYWPKEIFNVLNAFSTFFAINIASTITSVLTGSLVTSGILQWKETFLYQGILTILIGLFMFFVFKNNDKKNTTEEVSTQKNETKTWSRLFADLPLCSIILVGVFTNCAFNVLRDGWLSTIVKDLFPALNSQYITDFIGGPCFGVGCMFLPSLALYIGVGNTALIFTGIQILACLGIAAFPSMAILKICAFFIATGGVVHTLVPCLIGTTYLGEYSAFLFGIANFCAMMLGGAIPQSIAGRVIDFSWMNRGSPMLNGSAVYNAKDVFFLIKILTVPAVIAFLLTLYYLLANKRKNKSCCPNNHPTDQ